MLDYLYDVCLERLDEFVDIELQETFNNYFYKRVVDVKVALVKVVQNELVRRL